jgi:hypothetical protein
MKPEHGAVIRQGLVAGLIGCLTVILVFAVLNLLAGRSPFHTAALLGGVLVSGLRDPGSVVIAPGPILAYNALHLIVFLGVGLLASGLAYWSERGPAFWYLGLVLFILVLFHLFAATQLFTGPLRSALPPVQVWGAGIGAALAMAAYLLWANPELRRSLTGPVE